MKRTIILLTAALFILMAAPTFAQSATANIAVSATVAATCTINANALAFGPYDTFTGAVVDAQTTITVQCTTGEGTSLTLDAGANGGSYASTARAMANGGSFLGYDIYEDAARLTAWNGAHSAFAAATSSAVQTFNVYGRIAASQDVPAGTYNDTVTATVNW